MVSSVNERTTPEVMFHASGALPGPSLGVVGSRADLERVVARMEALPSTVYLRGTITFFVETGTVPHCESTLMLRDVPCGAEVATAPSTAFYWAILQQAAALRLLEGRAPSDRPARKARGRFWPRRWTSNATPDAGFQWAACR